LSPRGVTIPEVREQLFAAAERVLAAEGPSGLTSRAITGEAGLAKGVLHNHFADLEAFLVEFCVDRIQQAAAGAEEIRARAGQGTVVANLTDASASLFGPGILASANLMMSRPSLSGPVREALGSGESVLRDVEAAFAAYLDAETRLGRIKPSADAEMLAFTLVGSVHHLFFTQAGEPPKRARIRQIVASLVES
jgi:AcrR family transcriptional regulator